MKKDISQLLEELYEHFQSRAKRSMIVLLAIINGFNVFKEQLNIDYHYIQFTILAINLSLPIYALFFYKPKELIRLEKDALDVERNMDMINQLLRRNERSIYYKLFIDDRRSIIAGLKAINELLG